ncbi:DUF6461 domain-containing protein [Streptomyces sp. cg36]|uniref:DUF6461 domain-containing protein n=1 Tax=Streptomyces sp. cg36 TaxID=3238798 RepID=UPI0034E1E143
MSDGIQWLAGLAYWDVPVVFARGVGPEELARRLSLRPAGAAGSALRPMTDRQARAVVASERPPDSGEEAAGVVRVGECAGWSFALEYGDGTAVDQLTRVSRGAVEAVHLLPSMERSPSVFQWARDGERVCSFTIGEECRRQGRFPDLLVPDLVLGGVLADGETDARPEEQPVQEPCRLTLGVVERRFGLSLPREHLEQQCESGALLPAFAVRGAPDDGVLDEPPDTPAIRAWATSQGYTVREGRIPADLREAYKRAHRTPPGR